MGKRTPVAFPKMKVRGRRNRARSAERHTLAWQALVRVEKQERTSGMYHVRLVVDPVNGTHLVRNTVVRDGWGRVVA